MDPVRESQGDYNNLLIDEVNYFDGAYWVEAAWICEDAADVLHNSGGAWMDGVGVRCVEVRLEVVEDLSDLAESALETSPEEEEIEGAVVTTKGSSSCLETHLHGTQKSCQSTSAKDSRIVVKRANFRSSISRNSYKCGLGCDAPAFKWPKDLRRHIKDIHETTARYRCTAAGHKCGEDTVCQPIKRKDNFRRHLQSKHKFQTADLLDLDLDQFLVPV